MKKKRHLIGGLVVVLGAGAAYAGARGESSTATVRADGPSAPEVPVAEVVVRTVAPRIELTGTLEPVERVALRARVPGVIESVRVPEGGLVRRGQALFRIDPRPYRIGLDRARAELAAAEHRLVLADDELARSRTLAESSVVSASELDALGASAGQARGAVDAARANVRARALELEYTRVQAPIAGRVSDALVKTGNLVSGGSDASTPLAEIVSLDPLHVRFDVDEPTYRLLSSAPRAEDGRIAGVSLDVGLSGDEGFPLAAALDYLDPALDPESGTARARAVLPNPDHRLSPGLFVRVRMPTGAPKETLLVADSAVRTDASGRYVLVVEAAGTVAARLVVLGPSVDGLRVVTHGLSASDRVVLGGMVRPGMSVRPREVEMPGSISARVARRAR